MIDEIIRGDIDEVLTDVDIEFFKNKKILVTGGAGFLGSWICDVLIETGAKVICVDNFSSGRVENVQHLVGLENFSLIKHDVSQPIFFDESIDVVMHLASRASPFEFARFPIQILKANILGTWVALGIAKEHGSRLVYTSSSEIYGDPDPEHIPTSETYTGNVNPVGPRSCFSEDTEVLTKKGWKFFREVERNDEILTLNEEGVLEYQRPLEVIKERYIGDMIKFKNTKIDLLVTPNHRMYVRERNFSEFRLVEAFESIRWERAEMQKRGRWEGEDQEYFYLPPVSNNKVGNINKIKMDDWLEFLGYYISEGCVHIRKREEWKGNTKYINDRYNVLIAQDKKNSEIWNKIRACLEKLPFNFYDSDDHQFRICNKQLGMYLRKLGKSTERFIPVEFKNLSKRQLKILFDALMVGDGSKSGKTFYSSSLRLIGDVQEILLKIDMNGNIVAKDKRKNNSVYQLYILTDEKKDFLTSKYPKRRIEHYGGFVYCVNVPNHIIYVRRNGKALFCGNCYDEAKRAGEAFIAAYVVQHGLDARILRIFNCYGPRMRPGDVYGRVVPRFIDQALSGQALTVFGDGSQTRSFTYVKDMVVGILKAAQSSDASGEVFNLGSDVETRIIDLARLTRELTGSKCEIEFHPLPIDDPMRRRPDITKAREMLGWEPRTSLRQGLSKTIEWFRGNMK